MQKYSNEQYCMSEQELRAVQLTQIKLISEVDRICKKNNIQYNMVGGTMLGAIRHSGYIPWDDDADIGFLRSEYEKFRKACKTDLDEDRFYFQDCRDTKGYRWGYGKLRMKNTKFVRLNQEYMPYQQGISIDIMPFDNVPDGYIAKRLHMFKCFLYRKIFWSAVGRFTDKSVFKRFIYSLLYLIPEENLFNNYQRFIDACSKKSTKCVRILTFPTPKGVYGYDRKWYTELQNYQFENLTLPGAKDYDGYLKIKYKDYMKMPPKEKRKIHPISSLKLLENDVE